MGFDNIPLGGMCQFRQLLRTQAVTLVLQSITKFPVWKHLFVP